MRCRKSLLDGVGRLLDRIREKELYAISRDGELGYDEVISKAVGTRDLVSRFLTSGMVCLTLTSFNGGCFTLSGEQSQEIVVSRKDRKNCDRRHHIERFRWRWAPAPPKSKERTS